MGSRAKEKRNLSRAEAVQRIETFLEQLKQGTVIVADEALQVPDQVRLELEVKKSGVEIELEWKEAASEEQSEAEAELGEGAEQQPDEPAAQA